MAHFFSHPFLDSLTHSLSSLSDLTIGKILCTIEEEHQDLFGDIDTDEEYVCDRSMLFFCFLSFDNPKNRKNHKITKSQAKELYKIVKMRRVEGINEHGVLAEVTENEVIEHVKKFSV